MKYSIKKLTACFIGGLLISSSETGAAADFQEIQTASVFELKSLLEAEELRWPPNGKPTLLVKSLPQDFADIQDAQEKKQLFVRLLTPIILAENRRLSETRALAEFILSGPPLSTDSPAGYWLQQIKQEYRLPAGSTAQQLLQRLDSIPATLVMAQAAIESGWGTSRFALQGNSLFGQWTWRQGDGLKPENREDGATHEVAAFDSLRESVRAYMNNLNTHRAYRQLRGIRAQLRAQGKPLDAYAMAAGLHKYSARGDHYVDEIRNIINSRALDPVRALTLQAARDESTGG